MVTYNDLPAHRRLSSRQLAALQAALATGMQRTPGEKSPGVLLCGG